MKLKKLNLIILVLGLVIMTSCKDEATKAEATPETTQTETKAVPNETTPALNPAHGEPGHRCELPVGAPLDGTNATPPQNTTTTNGVQSTTVSPIRVDQSPSVNPPHGEPGHDCAVPVGAPLNK